MKNQVEKLIDHADSFKTQLMIMFMVQSGMRVGELTNFKIEWINFESKSIYIQENETPVKWSPKRDSARRIPLSDQILKNLERQIGKRKLGYVFQSQKSKGKDGNTYRRYEYRSIGKKINNLFFEVFGKKKKRPTHIFRATYASHLLKEKVDLESIRKLLGHSDIRTTLLYIRNLPDFASWDLVKNVELMKLDIKLKTS